MGKMALDVCAVLEEQPSDFLADVRFRHSFQPIYKSSNIDQSNRDVWGYELYTMPILDRTPIQLDHFFQTKPRDLCIDLDKKMIQSLYDHSSVFSGRSRLFINVSTEEALSALDERFLERGTWVVELTEQVSKDLKFLEKECARLKEMGFKIALDDFGTGFNNLDSLLRISPDIVKFDKLFIRQMQQAKSLKVWNFIRFHIQAVKSLGMTTVMEGIENSEDLAIAQSLDIDYMQGYHIGKPMPIFS